MAIHPKAWLENAPGRKQHYVMPVSDIVFVDAEVSQAMYVNGTLKYQGRLDAALIDALTELAGGETRELSPEAFAEIDDRFPPHLLDIEWEATNQNAPVNRLRVTGM